MAGTNLKKQFAGKVAVVTGGTQGLGEAIATLFAERGAAGLVIVGRNARKGKDVAAASPAPASRRATSRPTSPRSRMRGR
jgi:NAD(P)-dependent dehydrogenase (short-subunit alcohol dehydrogenase family)